MSVSIVASPDPFALTKGGRMTFRFQGSGRYATLGTPADSVITIFGPIPAGQQIPVRWNGRTVTLVARTVPSAPNEIPAGDGGTAHADAIAAQLAKYYPFREDFTVSRFDFGSLTRTIAFTGKQPGSQYNFAPWVSAPLNAAVTTGTNGNGGADPILRSQYSVYVELWVARPGETEFRRVDTKTIETSADGQATYDVGNTLHAEMLPDWPTWSFNQPTGATTSHLRYYIAYGEAFSESPGKPLEVGLITDDEAKDAYFGGVDFQHRAGSGFSLSSFVKRQSDAGTDLALRYGSLTRYVRSDEPQFLTFLNTRADRTGVVLEVKLTFGDGSTEFYYNRYAPQALPTGAKITYAVGPAQLNIANHVTGNNTLLEYSVRLSNDTATSYYSTSYRFVLAGSYQPYVKYFSYLNSLGAPETLTTYGKGSSELNRFFEQAERYLPANYDAQLGQFVSYDVALQQQIEVTTGFRSKEELKGWNDFYVSRYLFHMQASKALPIAIVSKSIKQGKDGDTLFAHKFEFQYLWKDDFYTSDDNPELIGDPLPPAGGTTGPITITQPVVVDSVDHTIPDVVREITPTLKAHWDLAYAWGNHATQGYLTQATGSQLFYRKDQKINFLSDVVSKPNSRDGYGIADVLTASETDVHALDKAFTQIEKLVGFRPVARSWTDNNEPV
jgi:hypothetical protein